MNKRIVDRADLLALQPADETNDDAAQQQVKSLIQKQLVQQLEIDKAQELLAVLFTWPHWRGVAALAAEPP